MPSTITVHSPANFSEVMQAIESFQEAHPKPSNGRRPKALQYRKKRRRGTR
jgi:hypothetical protein